MAPPEARLPGDLCASDIGTDQILVSLFDTANSILNGHLGYRRLRPRDTRGFSKARAKPEVVIQKDDLVRGSCYPPPARLGAIMMPLTQQRDAERLSELIGAIYDCVLDPTGWVSTLDGIRRLLDCANCVLYLFDPQRSAIRLYQMVGIEPHWAERMEGYGRDIAAMHARVPDFVTRPLGEPFVCTKDVPAKIWYGNRYYREWAEPQGIVDVIDTILMRRSDRLGSCALCRHESAGQITEREIGLMGMLAPHLRRAVTISDILDMNSVAVDAFQNLLDSLSAGIVLVAETGAILHANSAARRMLEHAEPISANAGRLGACEPATTERLQRLIAIAAREEAEIDGAGFEMPLKGLSGEIATAHVLPLARGDLRTRLIPGAVAAVFVASGAEPSGHGLRAFAEAFGLTPGETRLLERLMQGDAISDAAQSLRIAKTTAKTHLSRVMAKTGTRRQTSLLALVHRLAPAITALN